jgi:spore maturation protein CgeB
MKTKKAIIVLNQYDYGIKERGYSFEYFNIYLTLCDVLGQENILLFDFYDEFKTHGKQGMNKKLLEIVKSVKPDFMLLCLFENEFDENIIGELRNYTQTIAYFFDDPWRQSYVKHWIKYFNYFTTPDYYMFKQYETEGFNNAIYSPFGFNSNIYKKKDLPVKYDVSFVGGYSPFRKWIIESLYKEGIKVNVFGRKWGGDIKFISQEEIVNVFNQSIINLNLSNGMTYNLKYLLWSLKSIKAIKHNLINKKHIEQVKGRHFEINACGGFQLSYFIPGLNLIYEIDKEIAVFKNIAGIGRLIKFYLQNEELRNSIAMQGYNRSITEHSAQGYLRKMIEKVLG